MVSFQCDACQDVVKKPKLDNHSYRCNASFTCVDCSKTFNGPKEWKGHTQCISEAEKYQKGLYKGKNNPNGAGGPRGAKSEKVATPATSKPEDESPPSHTSLGKCTTSDSSSDPNAALSFPQPRLLAFGSDPGCPSGSAHGRGGRGVPRSGQDFGFVRGQGRGRVLGGWAPPNQYSSPRIRCAATGANDTPLGSPMRTFFSPPMSPTPTLAPEDVATDLKEQVPEIVAGADKLDVTSQSTAKAESGTVETRTEKKDKKKKRKSETQTQGIADSSGEATATVPESGVKTKPTKKRKSDALDVSVDRKTKKTKTKTRADDGAAAKQKAESVPLPSSPVIKGEKSTEKKSKKERVNNEAGAVEANRFAKPEVAESEGVLPTGNTNEETVGVKKKEKRKKERKVRGSETLVTEENPGAGVVKSPNDMEVDEVASKPTVKRKHSVQEDVEAYDAKEGSTTEVTKKLKKAKKAKKEKKLKKAGEMQAT